MIGRAETSLRGADLLLRVMFSFFRAGAIILGVPQSAPVYVGRHLQVEKLTSREAFDGVVGFGSPSDSDVELEARPSIKQEMLPRVIKKSEMF